MNHPSAQPRHKNGAAQTTPSTAAPSPVVITGIGLCCQPGTEPFALFGAVGTNLSGARAHGYLEAPLPGKKDKAPILYAPVSQLEVLDTPHDRIAVLAQTALEGAAEQLPEKIAGEAVLVLTLIPPTETPRGRNLNQEDLKETLASCHSRLDSACFRFVTVDQGPVETLQEICAELQQGKWQVVLFGGVDSLVDIVTCTELVCQGKAMPKGGIEGIIPGEGAAYLVLEKQPSGSCWAQIKATHTAPEPNHNQAHNKKMTGMTAAIQAAMKDTGIAPEKLDGIVLPFGGRMLEALEWHQVVETVWPRRENIPREFEILRPGTTLGETGAASLPLGLALGCARFEFDYPTANNLLVCTCHPATSRGAVSLKRVEPPAEPRQK
jgi:3-oxoacyl-[acyl-carrier-protein] synthase-1